MMLLLAIIYCAALLICAGLVFAALIAVFLLVCAGLRWLITKTGA